MDSKSPQPPSQPSRPSEGRPPPLPGMFLWVMLLVIGIGILWMYFNPGTSKISYSEFLDYLDEGKVAQVHSVGDVVTGKFQGEPPKDSAGQQRHQKFRVVLPAYTDERMLSKLLRDKKVEEAESSNQSLWQLFLFYLLPFVVLGVILWFFWRRTREQLNGAGFLGGFAKSPAKRYEKSRTNVTFEDVANLENAKSELQEVVEFLKNPEKFQRLGGQIPKGVLLMGPPGTGKTLLARAVAGEAGVPFYSISGSEFIQMFVGVGASRVRDMFKTAKENAPCILFIDEIDAVGRVRGAGLGGGHDEREQTLNQILSEMDGFLPNESVIVLAATNRPDVLDPALLRPGRFDRHVTVDRPSREGRHAIFKVHCRNVPLGDDVDLSKLAAGTVGLTGADIRNVVNESALLATRLGKERVEMSDFEQALDKVLMGPKREEVISGKEKEMTAYHEAGHALVALLIPEADPLHKVTIIPRGRSLGATQLLPAEDRHNISEKQLHARLTFALGGRAAEELVFDELSAGAENDLKQATDLARRMITHWGMSPQLGPVAFHVGEEHPFLGREIHERSRDFSEHTARIIDQEIGRILNEADQRAKRLLGTHRDQLDQLAQALVQREVLSQSEVEELLSDTKAVAATRTDGQT
jgi:cell division protease FtsH